MKKQVITITSSLKDRKKQQNLLDHLKNKPVFEEKVNAIKEMLKEVKQVVPSK